MFDSVNIIHFNKISFQTFLFSKGKYLTAKFQKVYAKLCNALVTVCRLCAHVRQMLKERNFPKVLDVRKH